MQEREGRTIGPYEVLEPLGRGGMGVVYRARNTASGALVALKTVNVPDATMLDSIRREIRGLARLSHPGIVRILDEGIHEGLPWYAMELLVGEPLRSLLRSWPTGSLDGAKEPTVPLDAATEPREDRAWWTTRLGRGEAPEDPEPGPARGMPSPHSRLPPEALREILTAVRRLCSPLGYMHGEGMVHRDLKPENVLVKPDGGVMLIDFGLLTAFAGGVGREALDVYGEIVGTVDYMSPEQGQGAPVDARSDLYALGCMLYELLTGQLPFPGATLLQALQRRYVEDPLAPSATIDGIPHELDTLVLRLLSRDPRERVGFADDVGRALAALGADGVQGPTPRPRSYLYRPDLAGRQAPLTRISESMVRLLGGEGSFVLLEGESGVGKTRLAMAAAARAAEMRIRVLVGECQPSALGSGPAPLAPLARPLLSIADQCRQAGREECDRVFGARAKLLSRYEPALRSLPGQEHHREPSELPADRARLRLLRALALTFEAFAVEGPLLLILDDVQWADELTAEFLGFVLSSRRLPRHPFAIVATSRLEERSALAVLDAAGGVSRVRLERLKEEDVALVVGDMLAMREAPGELVRFLARQSEGNPFFVAEYLRTAIASGLLARDDGGAWCVGSAGAAFDALPLPAGIRDLVALRLRGLSATARALVDAGAVLGRELDADLLAHCSGLAADPMVEGSIELLRRQVLEEPRPGVVRFLHDKLREISYDAIPPERVAGLHRAAARAIEERRHATLEPYQAALGRHWERGGETDRAAAAYVAGARFAVKSHAHAEAKDLYGRALRILPPSQEAIGLRLELACDVLRPMGEQDASIAALTAVLDDVHAGVQARRDSHQALGDLRRRAGEMDRARSHYDAALELGRQSGDPAAEGAALNGLAGLERRAGRGDRALALYREALDRHQLAGDRRGEVLTLADLAILHKNQGRPAEARALLARALAIARADGLRRHEAEVLGGLSNLAAEHGSLQESRELCEESLAIFRELGDRIGEAKALGNLAGVFVDQGALDSADGIHEQALAIARDVGHRRQEAVILGNMASAAFERGDLDEAFRLNEEAMELHRAQHDARLVCTGLLNLGAIHSTRRQYGAARAYQSEALAMARDLGDRRLTAISTINLAVMERLQGGDLVVAMQRAREGIETLEELGDTLTLAIAWCEVGSIELASGGDARASLERARELCAALPLTIRSGGFQRLASLEDTQRAKERGLPLVNGEIPDAPG
ncbi:MAG: tetratricopeptide repeat protein [Acidobacteriota bacterium]